MTNSQKTEGFHSVNGFAREVGSSIVRCTCSAEEIEMFITHHYEVDLDQLSKLHSVYFGSLIDLNDSEQINAGMKKLLDGFAKSQLSNEQVFAELFPDDVNDVVREFEEQTTQAVYETEMHNIQVEYLRACEAEDWAHR